MSQTSYIFAKNLITSQGDVIRKLTIIFRRYKVEKRT